MFLNNLYFQGELMIPNLKFRDCTATGVAAMLQVAGENTLEWFVEKYEKEFLCHLLGNTLYARFIEGSSMDAASPEYKQWAVLRDLIFVRHGKFSYSPCANYVYYWLMRTAVSQSSMAGEVKPRVDHAETVSPTGKLVKVWNDLLEPVGEIRAFIFSHPEYETFRCDIDYCFKPINSFNI